jgi:hypothetical protein
MFFNGGGGFGGLMGGFFGEQHMGYNPNERFNMVKITCGQNFALFQDYACFPVSFIGRDEVERGNKIILPPSALDTLARFKTYFNLDA